MTHLTTLGWNFSIGNVTPNIHRYPEVIRWKYTDALGLGT